MAKESPATIFLSVGAGLSIMGILWSSWFIYTLVSELFVYGYEDNMMAPLAIIALGFGCFVWIGSVLTFRIIERKLNKIKNNLN